VQLKISANRKQGKQIIAAAPKRSATKAGNTNIPGPIVIFITAQANPKTPIVRFRSAPVRRFTQQTPFAYLFKKFIPRI